MNHVERGRCFVPFAQKVTALLLVLTLVFALPIMASEWARNPADVPEGAVRVMFPYDGGERFNPHMADYGFDILAVMHQRLILDHEEISGWPGYEYVDVPVYVFYANAPASVLPVGHMWWNIMYVSEQGWQNEYEFVFHDRVCIYICESCVAYRYEPPRTQFMNAIHCPHCYWYLTFNEPGTYLIFFYGLTFYLIVGGADTPTATTPTTATPTTALNLATASSWAHDGITSAFGHGLIPSTLQSNYTQATTRAEFAAFAVALYETVTGREIAERAQFSDTTDINVQKMGGLGVVTGVGGGNFAPDRTLTRQEAAVMLARLADVIGQPLPPSAPTFADNTSVASWAVDSVGQMQASGIMGGVGNDNFAPSGTYTREQSIISMLRLFDLLR